MALVTIRRPKHFAQDGLWFEITVGNHTVSVLHNGPIWSAYGNTPFAFTHQGQFKFSFATREKHTCLWLLDQPSSSITLLIGNEQVLLDDL